MGAGTAPCPPYTGDPALPPTGDHVQAPGRFDRDAAIPAYHQVGRDLRARIRREEFTPGDRLPPEKELAEHYGISRMTLRQALTELAAEGLIERRHGSGTFVREHAGPIVHDLSAPLVFAAKMREQGLRLRPRLVHLERTTSVPGRVRRALSLPVDEPAVHILRVFESARSPIELVHHWLDPRRFGRLTTTMLKTTSLTTTLAQQFGVVEAEADVQLEAVECEPSESSLLKVEPGSPLVSLARTVYESDGRVLLCSRSLWPAGAIRFNFRIRTQDGVDGTSATILPAALRPEE